MKFKGNEKILLYYGAVIFLAAAIAQKLTAAENKQYDTVTQQINVQDRKETKKWHQTTVVIPSSLTSQICDKCDNKAVHVYVYRKEVKKFCDEHKPNSDIIKVALEEWGFGE